MTADARRSQALVSATQERIVRRKVARSEVLNSRVCRGVIMSTRGSGFGRKEGRCRSVLRSMSRGGTAPAIGRSHKLWKRCGRRVDHLWIVGGLKIFRRLLPGDEGVIDHPVDGSSHFPSLLLTHAK